ncbi:SpoIIE family protein phosphatase [Thermopolyspora sp. NPDC052614]|uniref:SpoIIE family protein phosphatase n=1 Tax=Thermopolyspora sp. NPDC052614 TaxID=3155682 RepID=UPI00344786C4
MTDPIDISALERALSGLATRSSYLRGARSAGEVGGRALDAALTELGAAEELLRTAVGELKRGSSQRSGGRDGGAQREQKLLRQVYRSLPVPVIVLDAAGTVRRVNAETSRLLGSPAGYLTGRAFPLLVDIAHRAAFRARLNEVLRGEEKAVFPARLSHQGRDHGVQLALTRLRMPGEPQPMVLAVVLPVEVRVPDPPAPRPPRPDEEPLIMAAARRYDLLSRLTRLLLDEESLRRPVALIRTCRMLGAELADWVIADVAGEEETGQAAVARAAVVGPADQPVGRIQRLLENLAPARTPVVAHVLETGAGVLHEMVDDEGLLGTASDGEAAAPAMGAGSVLSVPIHADEVVRGVLTLVRLRARPPFTLAELGLAEDIGAHLGPALRAQLSFRRRAQAAETLQTGVLPRTLPDTPGFEAAAVYHRGTGAQAIGGEFHDVFPIRGGWGFALGGAVGKGEEAAGVSAMVRGGFRVLSVPESDPAAVIGRLNDALVAQGTGMYVMAVAGFVPQGRTARGRIRLASAGHHPPAIIRADGGVRFTSGGGVPLGFEAGAATAAEEVTLAESETLVLYSDGLVGSRGRDGDVYGEARLVELLTRCAGLSPSAIVKAIEEDHQEFCGGRQLDEMTVLALRRSR